MDRDRLIFVAAALEFSWLELGGAGLEYKDACYLAQRGCDELKQTAKWSDEERMRIRATMKLVQGAVLFSGAEEGLVGGEGLEPPTSRV